MPGSMWVYVGLCQLHYGPMPGISMDVLWQIHHGSMLGLLMGLYAELTVDLCQVYAGFIVGHCLGIIEPCFCLSSGILKCTSDPLEVHKWEVHLAAMSGSITWLIAVGCTSYSGEPAIALGLLAGRDGLLFGGSLGFPH